MMKKDKKQASFSQNFLHNSELVVDLIKKSNLSEKDHILEIGPGQGIITRELAKCCQRITAIEYDHSLYQKLKKSFSTKENVEIIHQDFLNYRLPNHCYKVFANIPFHITLAIIRKLTEASHAPEDAYLIMQKEAAWKCSGRPYYQESLFSLLLKPHFKFTIIHQFKNGDFTPRPKVRIVMLHIKKRKRALLNQVQLKLYQDLLAFVFKQSNQGLHNKCKKIFTFQQFKRLASDNGFNLKANPTDLSFQQWQSLFRFFSMNINAKKCLLVRGAYTQLLQEKNKPI